MIPDPSLISTASDTTSVSKPITPNAGEKPAKTSTPTSEIGASILVGKEQTPSPSLATKTITEKETKLAASGSVPATSSKATAATEKEEEEKPFNYFGQWSGIATYLKKYMDTHPDLSPKMREKLTYFGLQYLTKGAHIRGEDAVRFRRDISPLQNPAQADYHREYYNDNVILSMISKEIGYSLHGRTGGEGAILLVNSPDFKKQMRQIYDYQNLVVGIDGDLDDARKAVRTTLEKMLSLPKERNYFFRFPLHPGDSPAELGENFRKGSAAIYQMIDEEIKAHCDKHHDGQSVDWFRSRITMGAFAKLKGQDVLLLAPQHVDTKIDFLRDAVKSRGYTPMIQRSGKILSRVKTLDEVMKSQKVEPTELPKHPSPPKNLKEFFDHPSYRKYSEKFSDTSKQVGFLASNLCKMIEGFEKLSLEKAFENESCSDVLQDSFGRILTYMEKAVSCVDKEPIGTMEYENTFELCVQEINLWLIVARPYKAGTLEKGFVDALSSKTGIRPQFTRFTHSATRCLSEITDVVSKLANRKPNVMAFDDVYWEQLVNMDLMSAMDKGKLTEIKHPDYEKSLDEQIKVLTEKNQKIDSLYIDPHSSIVDDKLIYGAHDVTAVIKKLIDSGCANKPLTVIMDKAIGFIQADEMDDVLLNFKKEIEAGELNVVMFTSHQKLDIFGTDNVNAGTFCVYSAHKPLLIALEKLDKPKTHAEKMVKPEALNYQFIAHMYQHNVEGIEEYRRRIFNNVEYVYQHIHPSLIYKGEEDVKNLRMFVAAKPDETQNCIVLYAPEEDDYDDFTARFMVKCEEQNIPPMFRSSYGYRDTVFTHVLPSMRLGIGIEDKETLDKMIKIINEILLEMQ